MENKVNKKMNIFSKSFFKIFMLLLVLANFFFVFNNADAAILPYRNAVDVIKEVNIYDSMTTDKFAQFLSVGYKSYALYKADMLNDYNSANHFAKKALDAYSGVRVLPERISDNRVPLYGIVDLDRGYEELNYMLQREIVELYPFLVADAQTKYDCWYDQLIKGLPKKYWGTCKDKFDVTIRLLYQKMDEDCAQCKIALERKKQEIQAIKAKKPTDDFKNRFPKIPTWQPDNAMLVANPPKAYLIDLPDVLVNSNKELVEEIRSMKDMLSDLDGRLAKLNADMNDGFTKNKFDMDNLGKKIDKLDAQILDALNKLDELRNRKCEKCDTSGIEAQLAELRDKVNKLATIQPVFEKPEEEEEDVLVVIEEETPEVVEENQPVVEQKPEQKQVACPDIDLDFPIEIFFDWGSYKIDPRFECLLKQVAGMMERDKTFSLVVEGHTDTSGPADFNMDLSERRAENVRKAIASYKEIEQQRFIVVPKGQTDLKVQTADGVKNPENRRVKLLKVTK